MKNKMFYIIFSCLFFLTLLYMLPSLAFFHATSESSESLLATGEWIPAQTKVQLQQSGLTYTNEESIFSYSDEQGEHFQITVTEKNPQFLSFKYKIKSEETAELFDSPVVAVFIGQTPVLQIAQTQYDTGWHEAFIDLSNYTMNPGVYDVTFQTFNTFDDRFLPNFSVAEVTTTKFLYSQKSVLRFIPNKAVKSVKATHKVWQNEQETAFESELEPTILDGKQQFYYSLPSDFVGNELAFSSLDLFGNTEVQQFMTLFIQNELGAKELETELFLESDAELFMQVHYYNSSIIPKYVVAKVSQNPIISDQNWNSATVLLKKRYQQYMLPDIPIQTSFGASVDSIVFENLPKGNIYLSIKLCNIASICEYVLQNEQIEYP